ncbi:hypothetical protein ACLE0P_003081 [Cronobacter sakazakii]|uniref:hypothetical protein n=1 Tax=Cronobacter sakazakii TaxID=28141 RepID=UPI00131A27F5|nr:hypothetical protein [Cronobacter sakazakii]ELY7523347.1 hypothetical protein [Cronobacter sakazakii]ELZ1660354.1 hypothetical protein [Cronobacter sakazakii]UWT88382.1 hypothetical protein N1710_05280 [Cronobacter sakazakii]
MRYNYLKETPRWMIFILLIVSLFAIVPIVNMIVIGYQNLTISFSSRLDLTQLGQFGDFFGGHTSAFAGSLSLVVVLFFTFHQSKQQRLFFLSQQADTLRTTDRQFFLEGINLITQWDTKVPGCDQCMRLLDYYGRLALISEDRELLLLLNTVMTAKIRENLEGKNGSFKVKNYPYACEAIERIRPLREADARAQKASKSKKLLT